MFFDLHTRRRLFGGTLISAIVLRVVQPRLPRGLPGRVIVRLDGCWRPLASCKQLANLKRSRETSFA